MDAASLVKRIAESHPDFCPVEQLRMALLVAQQTENLAQLEDADNVVDACSKMSMRLSVASDQHNAVAEELDSLAATEPCDFSSEHLWTLVRAIKVQSQILNLYLGPREAPTHLG